MLIGCSGVAVERGLRNAFGAEQFVRESKVPGLFKYGDLATNGLKAMVRFNDQEMTLENLLRNIGVSGAGPSQERSENSFSQSKKSTTQNQIKKREENQGDRTHPTPISCAEALPDHPHPTSTLIEGGQEPENGVGWDS